MKLFVPPLEISLDQGFTRETDLFGRGKFGETLFEVVSGADESFVLALDAPWGEGKTVFARMWAGYVKKQGGTAIYFDAFANDYLSDPFVALATQVYELLEKEDAEDAKKFVDLAKKAGRIVTRIGIKALTGVALDGTVIEDAGVADDISEEGAEAIDKILERRITGAQEDRATIDAFRSFLENYAEEGGSEFPLIFIIDELDRCRPDYALEILENIKHLFNVPSVIFVLVVNRSQLEESIRSKYGSGVDATKYLQKYVSIWANLPASRGVSRSQRADYVRRCLEAMRGDDSGSINLINNYSSTITELVEHFDSSLREIERCLTNFAIIVNATKSDIAPDYASIAVIVSVLKVTRPHLYSKMRVSKASYEEVLAETDFSKLNDAGWEHRPEGSYLRFILKLYLSEVEERKKMLEETSEYFREDFGRAEDVIPIVCGWLDAFSRR